MVFPYYKDRYSLQLLRYAVRDGAPVSGLKNSRCAPLLRRPKVNALLAELGNGRLTQLALNSADGDPGAAHYVLTLGLWGAEAGQQQQMSHQGVNLVLQLNFANDHDRAYRRYIKPADAERGPFEYLSHPIVRTGRKTLVWARLDVDLENGEGLIEEIQSDWVRRARSVRERAARATRCSRCGGKHGFHFYGVNGNADEVAEYYDRHFQTHAKLWDEAMLSASLWLLRERFGIAQVYYHTPRSGTALKRIRYTAPPRSLYSDLPRRFCFQEMDAVPAMLQTDRRAKRCLRRVKELSMYHLAC